MGQVHSTLAGWPDFIAGRPHPDWSGRLVRRMRRRQQRKALEEEAGRREADGSVGATSVLPIGTPMTPASDAELDKPEPFAVYLSRFTLKEQKELTMPFWKLALGSAVSTAGFAAVTNIIYRIAHSADPRFARLNPATKRRFPLYVNSLVHAMVVGSFALYKLVGNRGVTGCRQILQFVLGYFVNDLIATRQDWMSHPADLWHHVAGISIVGACLSKPQIAEFVPAFLTVEISTIFINSMWLLRTLGHGDGPTYKAFAKIFVLLFFVLRILWLPIATTDLFVRRNDKLKSIGPLRYMFFPINALQFYWFYKILQMVQSGKA